MLLSRVANFTSPVLVLLGDVVNEQHPESPARVTQGPEVGLPDR